jgi:hypothetical protein
VLRNYFLGFLSPFWAFSSDLNLFLGVPSHFLEHMHVCQKILELPRVLFHCPRHLPTTQGFPKTPWDELGLPSGCLLFLATLLVGCPGGNCRDEILPLCWQLWWLSAVESSLIVRTTNTSSCIVIFHILLEKQDRRAIKLNKCRNKTQKTHNTRETQIYVVHPVWATSTREIARSFLYYYLANEGIQPIEKPTVTSSSFSHNLLSQNTIFTIIHSRNTFPS